MWIVSPFLVGKLNRYSVVASLSVALLALAAITPAQAVAKGSSATKQRAITLPTGNLPITVSNRDLNRLVFPEAFTQVIFPAGAPLRGDPVYLQGNRSLLLQFQPETTDMVQIVVQMESGRVATLYLKPHAIRGITYRVESSRLSGERALPSEDDAPVNESDMSSAAKATQTLQQFASGVVPSGFGVDTTPGPVQFDRFMALPVAAWTDGSVRVTKFTLKARGNIVSVVAPPQFWRMGVLSVSLSGDRVSPGSSPFLYVAEAMGMDDAK